MSKEQYEGLGFTAPPSHTVNRRLVMSVAGFEKTGKTHFALTGRSPIAIVNLDVGLEGMVEKFRAAGKEVYQFTLPLTRDEGTQETWQGQWREFQNKLRAVYALNPGTVIIDTWTEAYELARLAHFGKLEQVMPNRYGAVFNELRGIVRHAYTSDTTTTVYIQKMRMGFESKLPEVQGFKDTDFLVQVNMRTHADENVPGVGAISTTIRNCRQNPHIAGMTLQGDTFDLRYLERLVHDWDGTQWIQR